MSTQLDYSEILITPSLLIDEEKIAYWHIGRKSFVISEKYGPDDSQKGQNGIHQWDREAPARPISDLITETQRAVSESLQRHLIEMICLCAVSIRLPLVNSFPSPSAIKNTLAPSLRTRLYFLDRRQTVWRAVLTYLNPVVSSLSGDGLETYKSSHLAWDIYRLVLAARTGSQVVVFPRRHMRIIDSLLKLKSLTQEARVRLSVLRGLFRAYNSSVEMPGFQLLHSSLSKSISERLEEIVEDAYLLEASFLRRLLGFEANKAAIRRDLRRLVNFIVKNRPWAKGLLKATSQTCQMGAETLTPILETIPANAGQKASPVLISPISYYQSVLTSCPEKVLLEVRNSGNSVAFHYWRQQDLDPKFMDWWGPG